MSLDFRHIALNYVPFWRKFSNAKHTIVRSRMVWTAPGIGRSHTWCRIFRQKPNVGNPSKNRINTRSRPTIDRPNINKAKSVVRQTTSKAPLQRKAFALDSQKHDSSPPPKFLLSSLRLIFKRRSYSRNYIQLLHLLARNRNHHHFPMCFEPQVILRA